MCDWQSSNHRFRVLLSAIPPSLYIPHNQMRLFWTNRHLLLTGTYTYYRIALESGKEAL